MMVTLCVITYASLYHFSYSMVVYTESKKPSNETSVPNWPPSDAGMVENAVLRSQRIL